MNRYNFDQSKSNDKSLARAYVPFQYMNQVYSSEEALKKGGEIAKEQMNK